MPEMKRTSHMIMPISQPEENSSGITATAEYPGQSSLRHGSPGSADKAVSLQNPITWAAGHPTGSCRSLGPHV